MREKPSYGATWKKKTLCFSVDTILKETKHDIKHHQVISSNWTCMWTKAHILICFVSDTSSNTFVHYQVDVGVIQPQSAQISRGFPETSATSWGPRSCEVTILWPAQCSHQTPKRAWFSPEPVKKSSFPCESKKLRACCWFFLQSPSTNSGRKCLKVLDFQQKNISNA